MKKLIELKNAMAKKWDTEKGILTELQKEFPSLNGLNVASLSVALHTKNLYSYVHFTDLTYDIKGICDGEVPTTEEAFAEKMEDMLTAKSQLEKCSEKIIKILKESEK